MPTETLARTEEITGKIGYTDDSTSDADLQELLEEGHRDMEARVGRNFTETSTLHTVDEATDNLVTDIDLSFRPVFRVDKVVRMDTREVVDTGNYTVDKENGSITFTATYRDEELFRGVTLQIMYVPMIYKDLELWCSVLANKTMERVQFEDSEESNLYRNAAVKAKTLENRINRKVGAGSATDGHVRRGTK